MFLGKRGTGIQIATSRITRNARILIFMTITPLEDAQFHRSDTYGMESVTRHTVRGMPLLSKPSVSIVDINNDQFNIFKTFDRS
jgi:hypothetical protein